DVTAGGVNLESDPMLTDKPVAVVRLAPRSSSEATSFTSRDFGNPTGIRFASIPAQSAEDGQRIVNAIKWAVGLCNVGAKKGPF
ncbi:MAG TPA: hypothetical protein VG871_04240, partial [Vicinamibacterales bacterium]|nr:hypothetical protein [Vicinamibacterales bacterium]